MSRSTVKGPPSIKFTAELFAQLAQMEDAGLAALQSFSMIKTNGKEDKQRILDVLMYLNSGCSIADSCFRSHLVIEADRHLIGAAEMSGQLNSVYKYLARDYEDKLLRQQKVKARLYLPGLILVLAVLIQPLPQLINSKISVVLYLQTTVGALFVLGLVILCVWRLPRFLERVGLSSIFHFLQFKLPIINRWIQRCQINDFLSVLAMMLAAGVSFSDALPKSILSVKNTYLRKTFSLALSKSTCGLSVRESLSAVPAMTSTALQVINSAEQSGKLAESLLHFTRLESQSILIQNEILSEWLPRLVYLIIVIWMIKSILGSTFSSAIPI